MQGSAPGVLIPVRWIVHKGIATDPDPLPIPVQHAYQQPDKTSFTKKEMDIPSGKHSETL